MVNRKVLSHAEEQEQVARDYRDHNLSDLTTLEKILFETVDVLDNAQIPYALIGGLAVQSLGRPRITHDIDLFVCPEDASRLLKSLEQAGFTTQERDPSWLFKAWKEDILVDIIFKSSGDIYFDEDIRSHVRRLPYKGHYINAISPEDFLVIKSAAHQENNSHHWYDALAVLKQGEIDWEYLLKRARNAPRRVLSLLIYGQSNDIAVPNEVIEKLFELVFEPQESARENIIHPYREITHQMPSTSEDGIKSPIYTKGRIMEALTLDQRVPEHDIKLIVSNRSIVANGEVYTDEQMHALEEVIAEIAPGHEFKNYVNVRVITGPQGSEAIK